MKNGKRFYECECSCGNIRAFRIDHLRSGASQSCGCLQKEIVSAANSTHGMSGSPEFYVWSTMIQRCTNTNHHKFPNYGGRGISICAAWLADFNSFYADMGPRPSSKHSIDRINNDGNYEPSNCRWATASQQVSNRRPLRTFGENNKNSKLRQSDVEMVLSSPRSNQELARLFNVSSAAIYNLRNGKSWKRTIASIKAEGVK